jgi:hypothetical protein
MSSLLYTIGSVLKEGGVPKHKLIFMPHVSIYDFKAYETLRTSARSNLMCASDIIPNLFPESFARVPTFTGLYKKMDFAIGMRGHSNMIPFGHGTPYLALGKHVKNKNFVNDTGGLIANDKQSIADLRDTLKTLFFDTDYQSNLVAKKNDMQVKFNIFNNQVLDVING